MTPTEPIPIAEETRDQLDRMLASKRFKKATTQAKFLEFVVRRAIVGKKSTEDQIGRWLFGPKFKKDESSDVRVAAIALRRNLSEYKANEGADDPASIMLPEPQEGKRVNQSPGEAYLPVIAYNPNSELVRAYRLGVAFLSPRTPQELPNARDHFLEVLRIRPDHLGAQIGMAEVMCMSAFTLPRASIFVGAGLEEAAKALKIDPSSWHAHAVAGATWLIATNLKRATVEFEQALAIDKRSVLQYGWYHAFLLATDRRKEAVKLSGLRANANPGDAQIAALHGAFLYANRQLGLAQKQLLLAVELDCNCWFAYLMLGLVAHALGDPSDAFVKLARMDRCISPVDTPFFPGLTVLFYLNAKNEWKRSSLYAAAAEMDEARGLRFMQTALAILGMGIRHQPQLFKSLYLAWRFADPLILFLHALPLFDSICALPDYQELVKNRFTSRELSCLSFAKYPDLEKVFEPE